MTGDARVGVLGGTFDPVHVGHLASARAAQDALGLTEVRLIPSHRPPHRPGTPVASGEARLAMIELAIAGNAGWHASNLELRRPGASYTYDTLTALHAGGLTPSQIFFIVGADAFAEIHTWSRYPAVLDAAHFAVIARHGTALRQIPQQVPEIASRLARVEDLRVGRTSVVFIEADTPQISSTMVRERAGRGEDVSDLVTRKVADYIVRHGLYQVAEKSHAT